MTTFVLVHGACHDGSAWDDVVVQLQSRGHTAYAPTVAGHGKGSRKDVTHAESTQSVLDYIIERELVDIVLVGHSYGGTIIAKLAEQVPDRVRHLVFCAGMVLRDGETMLEVFPPEQQDALRGLAAASSDNSVTLPFEVWRDTYINDATPELAEQSYAKLSSEPFAPLLRPLEFKTFFSLGVPTSYVIGRDDRVMPPGEWAWHPRMSRRLGPDCRIAEIPGSHELMFSAPERLATAIVDSSA
ncbi:alpha/beta fold hydrolase [Mycolicibacterium poriferae]|mgnify:CR=1 FL=1|uniref:alpha/beta fold hydrolase n=1 Tax=Mycolicibacterium poriferae TaxID=39694 RepID=UPI0024B9CCD5|nr:alpha/beta hydrolase [Mycolicibacterium poriferae]